MRLSVETEPVKILLASSKKTVPELLQSMKFEFINPTELTPNHIHYLVFTSGDPNSSETDGKLVVANADFSQIRNIVVSTDESWLSNVYLFSMPFDPDQKDLKLISNFVQAKREAWNNNLPWKKLFPKDDEFGRPWWKKYKDITNQYITIRTTKENGEVELKYYDVSSLKKDDVVLLVRGLLNESQSELKTKHESQLDKELDALKHCVSVVQYKHEENADITGEKLKVELMEATEPYNEPGSGNIDHPVPNTSLLEEIFESRLKTKLEEQIDPTTAWFDNVRRNKIDPDELAGITKQEAANDPTKPAVPDFQVRNESEKAILEILEDKASLNKEIRVKEKVQDLQGFFGSSGVPTSYVQAIANALNKKESTKSLLVQEPPDKIFFDGNQDTIQKAFSKLLKKAEENVGKELKEVLENTKEDEVLENIVAEVTSDKEKQDQEMINHPKHYTQGTIEVSDFIIDQKLDFLAGNIVKYVCRHKFKGTPVQDLKKARWYLDKLIEVASKENK